MKQLGIYVHVPFCKQKCQYCDFISFDNKNELIDEYFNSLKQELKNELDKISKDTYEISTIYFGGGTPSFVNEKYIEEILNIIKEKFDIANSEITIEINPGTANEKKLKKYLELGINRLSIGLQSSKNELLELIGRIHTYEQFEECFNSARKIGFENINVDLMTSLPNQTLVDVRNSLEKVISLNPEHISVYSLILEENTPLEVKVKNKELELPDENLERQMYWEVKKILEKNGYIHYEISNFSKPDKFSKHNMNCWNQEEYLGFGLAAHSYFNLKRYSNTTNLEEYIKENGNKKQVHEIQNKEAQMKEYMMLGFRKIDGVSISSFEQKFSIHPLFYFRFEISKLEELDLIEVDLDNIKLTEKGIDLANQVFEEFV